MNATLPHGLITIGHTHAPSTDSGSHHADVLFERSNILRSFWKVHTIRHRVSKDPADLRCQNLFWRTWGNSRLSRTITTSTLTSLWALCQQENDIHPARKEIDFVPPASDRTRQKINSDLRKPPPAIECVAEASSATSLSLAHIQPEQQSRLAQGLKDRRTSIDETYGLDITIATSRRSSKSARPTLNRAGSSSSNRTSFGPPASRTKGRPSPNRRKSSQGAMPVRQTKVVMANTRSPKQFSKGAEKTDVVPSTMTASTFELPSASSWEDEPTTDHNRPAASTSYNGTPSELVEPNFRHKFAERIASSTNLVGIDRLKKTGSVVRFADEIPTDLRRTKTNESGPEWDNERRPSLTYRGSTNSVASIAVIDEDDTPSPILPRTKSQLSMMIEETRAQHEQKLLESVASTGQVGLSSRRRRDPTEEEKVLAMAHREGVTKAGGRQIRRGFKFVDEDESRYSSPSPPPIF